MFAKSFLIQFKSKNFMVDCERIGSKKLIQFLSEKFINKSDLSVGWEVGTSVILTIEIYLKHEEGSRLNNCMFPLHEPFADFQLGLWISANSIENKIQLSLY